MISRIEDVESMALRYGFLPFFENPVAGFSIAEHTPAELWFNDEVDGPWEWKGPLIGMGSLAYGKIFHNKAGFVSLEWLPHLMNIRRAEHPYVSEKEKEVLDAVTKNEALLSGDLKKLCGFSRPHTRLLSPQEKLAGAKTARPKGHGGYEGTVTRLQMSLRLVTANFEYKYTRDGRRYGWGVALYTTPELMYGDEIKLPQCSPDESFNKIKRHLMKEVPGITEKGLNYLIL